ncbi:hypothetical protein [Methylocaldum sp.]|jgi:hypothetical protein|uniref:hypothetical protein n=1 Tax=Methylocaldum sp. TaxID=1969727 RepID=UPI00321F7A89
MPFTPKEDKRFLELLISQRDVSLEDALKIFADRKGQIKRDAAETTLRFLQSPDLFSLVDAEGRSVYWSKPVFDFPGNYRIRFNGIAGKENNLAGRFCDRIDPSGIEEIAPGYVWATMKRQEPLRIVGECTPGFIGEESAPLLAERIRAFTHQFAFHLVAGHHDRIAGLFSPRAAKGQTLETLLTRIGNLEKEFGPFDYFDHVEVVTVYNGDVSGVDASAHMKLPKGIHRNEQRGLSRFQIISVCTPNGMFVHEYTVSLYIIEEDGFFRICDASAYYGY